MKNPTPRFGRFLLPLALCVLAAPAAQANLSFNLPEPPLATWSGRGPFNAEVRFELVKEASPRPYETPRQEWMFSVTGKNVESFYLHGEGLTHIRTQGISPRFTLGKNAPSLESHNCTKRKPVETNLVYRTVLHHGYRPVQAFSYAATPALPEGGELWVFTDAARNFVVMDRALDSQVACLIVSGKGWKPPAALNTRRVLPTMRLFAGPSE